MVKFYGAPIGLIVVEFRSLAVQGSTDRAICDRMTSRRLRSESAIVLATLVAWMVNGDARLLTAQTRGAAQPQQPQPAQRNLQVLPPDTPQDEVLQLMQGFSAALGVQCTYCHVQTAGSAGRGRGGRGAAAAFDYAADDLPQKKTARAMMRMVGDLNTTLTTAVGRELAASSRVGCITCHRGVVVPEQLSAVLDRATRDRGTAEAITVYRDLRRQDSRRTGLRLHGRCAHFIRERAAAGGPSRRRYRLAAAQPELFPQICRDLRGAVGGAASDEYPRRRDCESRKAVQLDPKNAQLQRQLEQLRAAAAKK